MVIACPVKQGAEDEAATAACRAQEGQLATGPGTLEERNRGRDGTPERTSSTKVREWNSGTKLREKNGLVIIIDEEDWTINLNLPS